MIKDWKQKISHKLWVIRHLTPLKVRSMFYHVHENVPYDKHTVGLKRAIHYGELYFLHSEIKNGQPDFNDRIDKVNRIIKKYTQPKDRLEYIEDLRRLRKNVISASELGFFSVGSDSMQNKIEAGYYNDAINSLDILISATILYPFIWRKIFLES